MASSSDSDFALSLKDALNNYFGHSSMTTSSGSATTSSESSPTRKRPRVHTLTSEQGAASDQHTFDATLVDDSEIEDVPAKRQRTKLAELPYREPTPPLAKGSRTPVHSSPASSRSSRRGPASPNRREHAQRTRAPSSTPSPTSPQSAHSSIFGSSTPSTPPPQPAQDTWSLCTACSAYYRPVAPGAPCICTMYTQAMWTLNTMLMSCMPFGPLSPFAWSGAPLVAPMPAIMGGMPGAYAPPTTPIAVAPMSGTPTAGPPSPPTPPPTPPAAPYTAAADDADATERFPQLPSYHPDPELLQGEGAERTPTTAFTRAALRALDAYHEERPTRPKPARPERPRRSGGGFIGNMSAKAAWRADVAAWKEEQRDAQHWGRQLARRVERWNRGKGRGEEVEYATPEEEEACGPQRDWVAEKDELEGWLAIDELPARPDAVDDDEDERDDEEEGGEEGEAEREAHRSRADVD